MENVKINTTPKGAKGICYASQYDDGRIVRFNLFSELLPYKLDGSETIKVKVVRPDNVEIIEAVTNTENYYIDVNISSDMTALAGVASCELEIKKGDTVIGSRNFDMNIESDSYGSDISIGEAQGVIATFETDIIDNLVSLKTTFEPKQDLHGFDTPWIDSNVVNKAPYLSRALAGTASRIGNYEFNKLVGGTYAFNQNIPIPPSSITNTLNDVTLTDNRDGSYTLSGTASADSIFTIVNQKSWSDHKYVLLGGAPAGSTTKYSLAMRGSGGDTFDFGNGAIWNASGNTWKGVVIYVKNGQDVNGLIFKPQLIDLTQLFGSTIADYIYSLETAQAGAGVSFFKALFDKDYYPYNAGELISVKPTAHITRDGNNTVISNTALDPDIELRGIPKLDENNNLYYDGDTYESNGDVTRRYGIVDLGSLTWVNYTHATFGNYFYANISNLIKYIGTYQNTLYPVLCHKYVTVKRDASLLDGDKVLCIDGAVGDVSQIQIKDTTYGTDAAALKASLNGVYLVYEKATPTTESADPFTDPQEIDAQGSEEFIDARAVSIPVGHESYYANICEIEGIDEITIYHSGEDTQDPESALVEIGQTVYGGYYDKDLGIVLTWSRDTIKDTPLSRGSFEGVDYFIYDQQQKKIGNFNIKSDVFMTSEQVGVPYMPDGSILAGGSNTYIYIRADSFTTVAALKRAVGEFHIYYELATPIIIPADAVNFETVKGVNNVWSDTNGETEVKFYVKEA